jgi:CheY-like chemotaxis protein
MLLSHCHPEDRRRLLAEWEKCVATHGGEAHDVEVRIRGEDGNYKWFRVSGTPVRDAEGRISKWIGTCKEVGHPALARRAAFPRSILVVDDNVDAVAAFSLILRHLGHEVEEAHDGVSALEVARRVRPEVVFLDLNMPRLGGHEVARALRADPAFARTLIIAVSGFGQPSDIEAARAAGFDHYLVKPYDIDFVKSLLGAGISQPRTS